MPLDRTGVAFTCPLIDKVIESLKAIHSGDEKLTKRKLQSLITTLEKIRNHNERLRDQAKRWARLKRYVKRINHE